MFLTNFDLAEKRGWEFLGIQYGVLLKYRT